MTNLEILESFEREINLLDDSLNKPVTDDSLYWLNQAVMQFVKTRFNGDFVKHQGFEQTEKRRRDLINLLAEKKYYTFDVDTSNTDYDIYAITYPADYLYELSIDPTISDKSGGHKMNVSAFECTQDSFMYRVMNSLTDFHYRSHRARPLRLTTDTGCLLLTDKNYKVDNVRLGYIRQPKEITLSEPDEEYSEFDNSTILEIIKIASRMYLENKRDQRYLTISNEVNIQE